MTNVITLAFCFVVFDIVNVMLISMEEKIARYVI